MHTHIQVAIFQIRFPNEAQVQNVLKETAEVMIKKSTFLNFAPGCAYLRPFALICARSCALIFVRIWMNFQQVAPKSEICPFVFPKLGQSIAAILNQMGVETRCLQRTLEDPQNKKSARIEISARLAENVHKYRNVCSFEDLGIYIYISIFILFDYDHPTLYLIFSLATQTASRQNRRMKRKRTEKMNRRLGLAGLLQVTSQGS